jgi:hypothetical protein
MPEVSSHCTSAGEFASLSRKNIDKIAVELSRLNTAWSSSHKKLLSGSLNKGDLGDWPRDKEYHRSLWDKLRVGK